jgi:hypothetical protein
MTVGSVGNSQSASTNSSFSASSIGGNQSGPTPVLSADSPVSQGAALRALDGVTGNRAASDAIARGDARLTAAAAETCTVEVRYTPVVGWGIANHGFIVTTDGDSARYFRGGPAAKDTGLNSTSSNSSSGAGERPATSDPRYGIYGPIVTDHGLYTSRTKDWTTSPTGQQTVAVRPGNCDAIEGQFARHANDIEAAGINYMPLGSNSNATVREILERAGYNDVQPVVNAPGWNTQLAMPR